ncbi:tRNA (N6-isopentenyl adenosine(37)-C2)-methylthiotransferase MiaB [bacterium]|nr:tRNA (N6-isopentenyl adenosine(37)-C2)-methylthiotransferase MiaB [bacterium]
MVDELIKQVNSLHDIEPLETMPREGKKKVYIETYGCQMNVYDSELVAGIMNEMDYELVDQFENADAIFLNTCAIRENAEQRVWGQLTRFKKLKEQRPDLVIGVLGCMAKHLEEQIHAKRPYVNVVLGPDSYRKLPELLKSDRKTSSNVIPIQDLKIKSNDDFSLSEYRDFHLKDLHIDTKLSRTEVYEAVTPLRFGRVTAWIAIMRGCDNFCTFCVVPFTRGRERSRSVESVIEEVKKAVDQGYTEVCLLGQNVNSYKDNLRDFAYLMERVSDVNGVKRIRFTSPHPKDFPERLLHLIAGRPNICKQLHMPVQSGSNRILDLMNRTYTREEYFELIDKTRTIIPDVAISTDVITGFPTETEEDHESTMDLFRKIEYHSAFTFAYSPRPGTKAYLLQDDVTDEVKSRRLQEIIQLQRSIGLKKIQTEIGREREVVIEEISKKSEQHFAARTSQSLVVVIPRSHYQIGDYLTVRITHAEGHTLFGEPV